MIKRDENYYCNNNRHHDNNKKPQFHFMQIIFGDKMDGKNVDHKTAQTIKCFGDSIGMRICGKISNCNGKLS